MLARTDQVLDRFEDMKLVQFVVSSDNEPLIAWSPDAMLAVMAFIRDFSAPLDDDFRQVFMELHNAILSAWFNVVGEYDDAMRDLLGDEEDDEE